MGVKSWKYIKTYQDACHLVERCKLLKWYEFYQFRKKTDQQTISLIINDLFISLARSDDLELDIIVENILSFCSFFQEETLLESLVDKMTENNMNINLGLYFFEKGYALKGFHNHKKEEQLTSMLIVLSCRFGLALQDKKNVKKQDICTIDSFISSKINIEDIFIKLSLMYYSCCQVAREKISYHQDLFDKIMNRFGYFVLKKFIIRLHFRKNRKLVFDYVLCLISTIISFGNNKSDRFCRDLFSDLMLKDEECFFKIWNGLTDHCVGYHANALFKSRYVSYFDYLMEVVSFVNNRFLLSQFALFYFTLSDAEIKNNLIIKVKQNNKIDESNQILFLETIKRLEDKKTVNVQKNAMETCLVLNRDKKKNRYVFSLDQLKVLARMIKKECF